MSVPIEMPQVDALRRRVGEVAGIPLHTHSDFEQLSLKIGVVMKDGLSPVTLERIWGYSTRKVEAVSRHSLDVLARYAGFKDWEDFFVQETEMPDIDRGAIKKGGRHRRWLWMFLLPICIVMLFFVMKQHHTKLVAPVEVVVDTAIMETIPDSTQPHQGTSSIDDAVLGSAALTKAKSTLKKAWDDAFRQVDGEMQRAGYVEFLPIHVDYGTYRVDSIVRRILQADWTTKEIQDINAYDEALGMEYSRRLYRKYDKLPSLYDKTLNIPDAEREYYQDLVAGFGKFVPYRGN